MAKARPVQGLDEQASLFANAAKIIRTRLDEMREYERYLSDADRSYELHQMRIAAKRLRYTLEIFEGVYARHTPSGADFSAAVLAIKAIQEHLGALHDADVLVPELMAHLARLLKAGHGEDGRGGPVVGVHHVDFEACQGLLGLCRETRDRRDAHYQKLLQEWQRLQEQGVFEGLTGLLEAAAR